MTWVTNSYRFGAPPFVPPTPMAPPNVREDYVAALDMTHDAAPLYEKSADTAGNSFALMQLLVALTALDHIGSLTDTATVATADLGAAGPQMGLMNADVLTYGDLIRGMLVCGGSDAAKCLGRVIGTAIYVAAGSTGSTGETRFCAAMLTKAGALGLTGTAVNDVTGNAASSLNSMTARDGAKALWACHSNATLGPWMDLAGFTATVTGANARSISVASYALFPGRGYLAQKHGQHPNATDPAASKVSIAFLWQAPNGSKVAVVALQGRLVGQAVFSGDILQGQLPQDFPYLDPSNTLTPADPSWSSVKFLLGCDGGTALDESAAGRAITTVGAPSIVTSPRLLGARSISFDGVDDYLSIADSDDWHFGSGDFSVEVFWRCTTPPPTSGFIYCLAGQYEYGSAQRSWRIGLTFDVTRYRLFGAVSYTGSAASLTVQNDYGLPTASYNHLFNGQTNYAALIREGTSLKLRATAVYADAYQEVTASIGSNALFNSTAPLTIGANLSGGAGVGFFPGQIDEVRITKGVARAAGSWAPAKKFARS